MGIIDQVKEVAGLVKAVGDIDLYRKIVDLQGEIVTMSGQNLELNKALQEAKKRIGQLENAAEFKSGLRLKDGVYWADGDGGSLLSHLLGARREGDSRFPTQRRFHLQGMW